MGRRIRHIQQVHKTVLLADVLHINYCHKTFETFLREAAVDMNSKLKEKNSTELANCMVAIAEWKEGEMWLLKLFGDMVS